MRDLIEKLQSAAGPSFELDKAIWCALNPDHDPTTYNGDPRWKPYTQSIDAAVTLVPDGWAWFAQWIGGEFSEGDARLWIPSQRTRGLLKENFDARSCANPAIALCIAALRARLITTGYEK